MSFPQFDRATELAGLPGDLAVLMTGVAARQGASRTATVQAGLPPREPTGSDPHANDDDPPPFAPHGGAFDADVAAALTRWHDATAGRQDE